MSMYRTSLAALTAILVFSGTAASIAAQRIGLELKDRTKLEAEVLGLEGEKVKLQVFFEGGSAEATRSLAEFTPKSQHQIRYFALGDEDYKGYLELAERAAASGMWHESRMAVRRARAIVRALQLDPTAVEPVIGRTLAVVETVMVGLLKEGQTDEAQAILTQVAQADSRVVSAEVKQKFVEIYDAALKEAEAGRETARAQKEDAAATARRVKLFESGIAGLQKARELHRKGLLASESFSNATNLFKQAEREFDQVIQHATETAKKLSQDPVATQQSKELKTAAEDGKIGTLLARGSLDLVRGKYHQATALVNKALAIDPENRQALEMRSRIEVAANSDDWALGPRY
jgi:tetratricopeptide (TPR) repeat protein